MCLHVCDMTHSYVGNDTYAGKTLLARPVGLICLHMCDRMHLHVWNESYAGKTLLTGTGGGGNGSFICVT